DPKTERCRAPQPFETADQILGQSHGPHGSGRVRRAIRCQIPAAPIEGSSARGTTGASYPGQRRESCRGRGPARQRLHLCRGRGGAERSRFSTRVTSATRPRSLPYPRRRSTVTSVPGRRRKLAGRLVIDVQEPAARATQRLLVGAGRCQGEPGRRTEIGPGLVAGIDVLEIETGGLEVAGERVAWVALGELPQLIDFPGPSRGHRAANAREHD